MTEPQTVYVLHYSHKHGDDISVYATQELAVAGAAGIARGYWPEAAGSVQAPDDMPQSPDGLSDEDAARIYFEAMDGQEWYEITAHEVIGGEPPAREHDPYELDWPGDAEREITAQRAQGQDPNHRLYVPPGNRIA